MNNTLTKPYPDTLISPTYFKVLEAVAKFPKNQRSIAKRSGLSLGMVNLVLNRLIETGYIRLKDLSGRRLGYLLTPKGIYEKTKRSGHYIQRTLSTYTKLCDVATMFLDDLIGKNHTYFIILGKSEISDLLCLTLSQFSEKGIRWVVCKDLSELKPPTDNAVLLDCSYQGEYGHVGISVIEKLLAVDNEISLSPSLVSLEKV